MSEKVMVHIWNGHFKVWGCDIFESEDESRVITYFGRAGLPMHRLQKRVKLFNGNGHGGEAVSYALNKIKDKREKGYLSMSNGRYFQFISDGNIKGLVNYVSRLKRSKEG